jgi:hypothetical protein
VKNNNRILLIRFGLDKVGVACGRAFRLYCAGINRGPVSASIPNAEGLHVLVLSGQAVDNPFDHSFGFLRVAYLDGINACCNSRMIVATFKKGIAYKYHF